MQILNPRPEAFQAAPEPTLRRLPSYLAVLKRLGASSGDWVSCTALSEVLGRDATQVRKDLSFTGVVGKPKVGYLVSDLIVGIERFLGWDRISEAVLAGVGNLGSALLGYDGFSEHGLHIVAAFDSDVARVGSEVHGVQVRPISELPGLVRRLRVYMGIVAVPAAAAQAVAEAMVAGGIRGIWNFAPAPLQVPDGVIVENEYLSSTLAVLSRRLQAARQHGSWPRTVEE